jgi:hypothetical protein
MSEAGCCRDIAFTEPRDVIFGRDSNLPNSVSHALAFLAS